MTSKLSPSARRILQLLNARNCILTHKREDDTWTLNGEDITSKHKDCETLLYLCCVRTLAERGYSASYVIGEEGQRCLAIPDYEPIILRRR